MIEWCNEIDSPALSLDVPSGLDASSGEPRHPVVEATATFTLALPKSGLMKGRARDWAGELYLGDIGVPPHVYGRFGYVVKGLFGNGEILSLI